MHGDCLIVEEEPILAKNMSKYLQRHDYTVRVVASADGAWREIRNRWPDIVVLDLESLGARGVDLLTGLIDSQPRIRIVLLSYQEDSDLALEALRLGAADLLIKPLRLDRLLAVVRLLMRHEQAPTGYGRSRRWPRVSLVWSRGNRVA